MLYYVWRIPVRFTPLTVFKIGGNMKITLSLMANVALLITLMFGLNEKNLTSLFFDPAQGVEGDITNQPTNNSFTKTGSVQRPLRWV